MINLSDRSISDTKRDALMKGLNFAVTPERLPVEDIVSATESVCRRLDFCHKKSTADKLRAEVTKILMKSKLPKSNVNRKERGAIKNLAKDEDIIILPADKGRSTVILNKRDYHLKMSALLDDDKTYEKLVSDPTKSYKNRLITMLKRWKGGNGISQELYDSLYPTAECTPKMYGLPKIHKKEAPLRPIVSSIGSVMYHSAKYLARVIGPLVGHSEHHIINSVDFVKKVQNLELSPTDKLVSYDVCSLFTSIPIDKAIKVIAQKLIMDPTIKDRSELSINKLVNFYKCVLIPPIFSTTTHFISKELELQWVHQFHPYWLICTWKVLKRKLCQQLEILHLFGLDT